MEELMQEFSNTCRFCSNSHEKLKSLFKEDEADEEEIFSNNTKIYPHIKITEIAEILLGITMNISDELPKFICVTCFDKLMLSYEFRQKCLLSIKNLKNKLYDERRKQKQIECQGQNQNNLICLNENIFDTQLTIKQELIVAMNENKMNNNELKINILLPKKNKKKTTITAKKKISLENINKISAKRNEKTVCSICGESYKEISTHMRLVHTIGGQYECEFCGKIFKAKAYLKTHFRIHLNVRKYKCKLCDKTYVERTSLRVHMLNHNDERKFKCQICDKSFKQSCDLGAHMKRHKQERNFLCDFCNRRFLTNQLKKRHEILHTNEYPFKCEFCTKSFKASGSLSIHRYNIHTKLNPYKCEICGETFARLGDFNTHKRQHEYKII